MKFSSNKNKIDKIYNNTQTTSVNLDIKENKIKKILNGKTEKYISSVLYDSDWIVHTPTQLPTVRSVNKDTLIPETIVKEFDIEIKIPEEYLPFLRFEKSIKPSVDSEAVSAVAYTQSTWASDGSFLRVKGDTTTIYEGLYQSIADGIYVTRRRIHDEDEMELGFVNENLTKKIYNGIIEYTDGGDKYKIEGKIARLGLKFDISTGCNGHEQSTSYNVQIDPDLPDLIPESKITTLDSSKVSGTFKKTLVQWEDRGSGCQQYVTTSTVTDTKFWSSVKTNHMFFNANKYKWIGGEWIFQSSGNFYVNEDLGAVITSREYTLLGYWLYYSTQFRALFGVHDSDFDGHGDDLWSPPNESDGFGALPYTHITLEQNFGDYPIAINTINQVYSSASQEVSEDFVLVRTDSDNIPVYKITSSVRGVIKAPANVENPLSPTFNVYDHIFTIVGGGYDRTTTDRDTKIKLTYISEKKDVFVRLRLVLLNRLFFRESRKY